jgi:hypothetical protein
MTRPGRFQDGEEDTMQASTGRFLPEDVARKIEKQMGPGNKALMPRLAEGELVEIKGVKFRVKRIKPFSGHLALQMVPTGKP